MTITQFKRRILDDFLVTIHVIKKEVQVEYEERICSKNFYTFIGVNIYGKKIYLTYGINYKEDTDFWIQRLKDIRSRGVELVKYIVTPDVALAKRASVITFKGVKVIESNLELIDKVNKYFPDNFDNKIPKEITKLYNCKTVDEYKEELKYFNEKYKDKKIIKLLLEENLNEIEKVYVHSSKIRKLLFTYYSARDYRRLITKENNRLHVIRDVNELFNVILENVIRQEKHMYLTKKEWLEILEEISENEEVRMYL